MAETDQRMAVILCSFKYSTAFTGKRKSFLSIKCTVAPSPIIRASSFTDASKYRGV